MLSRNCLYCTEKQYVPIVEAGIVYDCTVHPHTYGKSFDCVIMPCNTCDIELRDLYNVTLRDALESQVADSKVNKNW